MQSSSCSFHHITMLSGCGWSTVERRFRCMLPSGRSHQAERHPDRPDNGAGWTPLPSCAKALWVELVLLPPSSMLHLGASSTCSRIGPVWKSWKSFALVAPFLQGSLCSAVKDCSKHFSPRSTVKIVFCFVLRCCS